MCATLIEIMNRNWKFLFFFCSPKWIIVKNQRTITKFELDLRIPMKNLHMQFESYTSIQTKVWERKLKISIFFLISRGITLSKNQWTITKLELDLRIPMTNLLMQFEPYTCIQTKVRERKLKIFLKRDNSVKISSDHDQIRVWPA
jgi:hypothetical protein